MLLDLVDADDGENRAVRAFLSLYGGACGVTVIQMCDHMRRSGYPLWPDWAEPQGAAHLTKGGAQHWLRHLFALGCEIGSGKRYRIEFDGFVGTVIGSYRRLDGEAGVVMQQDGTKVVHVYRRKWLADGNLLIGQRGDGSPIWNSPEDPLPLKRVAHFTEDGARRKAWELAGLDYGPTGISELHHAPAAGVLARCTTCGETLPAHHPNCCPGIEGGHHG